MRVINVEMQHVKIMIVADKLIATNIAKLAMMPICIDAKLGHASKGNMVLFLGGFGNS